jgi:4-hydroxy-3-methylbut-2-enyl diphosphate reductase
MAPIWQTINNTSPSHKERPLTNISPANAVPLTIYLAAPRGFCAGVERAILIVENALRIYGPPVYVRHEIVHNAYVVNTLRSKGAVFVEELDEIPETKQPVIFSAHGVPKSVPADACKRNLFHIDATCPLVSKVHIETQRHFTNDREVILIGHAGHPEVDGTIGQLPDGAITLVETLEDAKNLRPKKPDQLALATQTTLSVDDTHEIVNYLVSRFPKIKRPHHEDICYATTNRQAAVKSIAPRADAVLVIGATNSSNSMRLVEVAKRAGCQRSFLITRASDIDWNRLGTISSIGITAGASAPELLVQEVIEAFSQFYYTRVETVITANETIAFKLPREVSGAAA